MKNRFDGITRLYSHEDVQRLRGTKQIAHTLANDGARKLWKLLNEEDYVAALGALSGNQAMQQVRAGLKAIYLSGWQVAADANLSGQMYPDQSLYPANSVPAVVKKINNTLQRADQISHSEGKHDIDWYVPIVADAEARHGVRRHALDRDARGDVLLARRHRAGHDVVDRRRHGEVGHGRVRIEDGVDVGVDHGASVGEDDSVGRSRQCR